MSVGSAQNLTGDDYSRGAATKTRNNEHGVSGGVVSGTMGKKLGNGVATLNSKINATLDVSASHHLGNNSDRNLQF